MQSIWIQVWVFNYNSFTLDFVENINEVLDNGEYIIGIFLDLTNLNINTLGIRGTPLFVALTNRKQYFYHNRTNSEIFNITCGIPQDSVSGPLSVFNCYQ